MIQDQQAAGIPAAPQRPRRRGKWPYLLLVPQFAAVLWPPFFNRIEPRFLDFPFFYWYQLVCIIIGAGLTAIAYLMTDDDPDPGPG